MAGADKVGNQPLAPVNAPRTDPTNRSTRRSGGTGFGERLSHEGALVRSESRETSRALVSDETYLRERTFEELKTLVQAIQEGVTDPWQLTDLIFYARHPEMKGVPLTHEHQAARRVEPGQRASRPSHAEWVSDFIGARRARRRGRGRGSSPPRSKRLRARHRTDTPRGRKRQPFDDVDRPRRQWCPGLHQPSLRAAGAGVEFRYDVLTAGATPASRSSGVSARESA